MSEITPNTPNPVREDAYKQQLAAKLGIDPQYIPGSPIWHSEEEIAAIAEMFSNMAGSSGGGVLVVNATESGDAIVCDKTAGEMLSAYKSGTTVIIKTALEGMVTYQNVTWVDEYGDDETSFHTSADTYDALTLDDYPSHSSAD